MKISLVDSRVIGRLGFRFERIAAAVEGTLSTTLLMRWQGISLLVVVRRRYLLVVVRRSLLVRARWRLGHLRRLVGLVLLTGRKRSCSHRWSVLLKWVSALVLHMLRRIGCMVVSGRALFVAGGN